MSRWPISLGVFFGLCCVLSSWIVGSSSGVKEFKLGVLLSSDGEVPFDVARAAPAVATACEKVNRDVLNGTARLVPVIRPYADNCDSESIASAAGLAADLFYNENVAAFVGPGCKDALDHVGRLAGYWNIPIITGLGDSGDFKNKTDFPTMTRFAYCQCRLRKVFGSIFRQFDWTNISLILDQDDLHGRVLGETLEVGLRIGGFLPNVIKYYGNENRDKSRLLQEASKHSRVIVLSVSGDSVRKFMLSALDLGYIDGGEHVFVDVELFPFGGNYWGDHSWKRGDVDDVRAKKAFSALLRISLSSLEGPLFAEVSEKIRNRSLVDYGFDYGDEQVNYFVGAFYDAVWHYGTALAESLAKGIHPKDGYNITRQMWNRTFLGITGDVFIDDNGDRDTSFEILDMNPDSGVFEPVAYYWGNNPGYTEVKGKSIHWAGGRKSPPLNEPICGFKNDNGKCKKSKPLSTIAIVLIVILCLVIVGAGTSLLVYRKYKEESELRDMSWLIKSCDVRRKHVRGLMSHEKLSMGSLGTGSTGTGLDSTGEKQVFTEIGTYKGTTVAIRTLRKKSLSVDRRLLREVRQRRSLQHDNIAKFIGVANELSGIILYHGYSSKGSLQDILANDSIQLDLVFKTSLIGDLVRGMCYIHNSDIHCHGRLRSSNCVIDGRFVLKLTDFGLPTFYETEDSPDEKNYQYYKKLLWVAPEILRTKSNILTNRSQKGDVYSFAIILEEIILRGGPFEVVSALMDAQDIVSKVAMGETPPFRPKVQPDTCPAMLYNLMCQCWDEDPRRRPEFSVVASMVRKLNKLKGEGSLMDNLLNRMEQYASNLEGVVAERTQLLIHEQKRTEQLLLQMLPRTIAEQLKQGHVIKPETFQSVTIFFSDIVGFTSLSASSTAVEIVNMLNDLYTCFDDILENFDVYKVETIGDAYMVVSGLPVRNGSKHVPEVARMSLRLLESVTKFRVRHRPNEILQLRIGIHTGSCAAGVVGLKMPRYCLFGDTVNTASRMESNGLPLKIHISPEVHQALTTDGSFVMEERGEIEIKGKGIMTTHWLVEEKAVLSF